MTEAFEVETIDLDLPPLVGAFSRRLHEAGLPITPARAADFARALTLVRPISRRRLYWTARSVFVSDPAQVNDFDAVFFSVFGHGSSEAFDPEDARTVASAHGRPAPLGPRGVTERLGGARLARGRDVGR